MKKCPNCKSVYTDDTLAYCLSDGTPLDSAFDSEQTLQLPHPIQTDPSFTNPTADLKSSQKSIETEVFPAKVKKNGVSPFWIYSTIGLLILILSGTGVFFLYFSDNKLNKISSDQTGVNELSDQINTVTPQNNVPVNKAEKSIINPKNVSTPPPTLPDKPTPKIQTYKVVGVAKNDVLYIRPAPGNLKSFLGKIPPDTGGIIITGSSVKSGKSVWYPINFEGTKGWVSGKYLAKE